MSEAPRGMKTNGIGQFVDWLNHDRSMADLPEFFSVIGGQDRADGYVMPSHPDWSAVESTLRRVENTMGKP